MKKLLLLITYNVSLIAFCAAQNPLVKQWDYRFGGTDEDILNCFQQTSDGGYILGGSSYSDSSGDKTQDNWDTIGQPTYDYWIVKIDSNGNKLWDKNFGGTNDDRLMSLYQTSDGGYILGGKSNSGISGDKTQATWGIYSIYDYWIIKIDSLGNKEWDKDFGGNNQDQLTSIKQTIDGGYILGGTSVSDSSGDKTQNVWHFANGISSYDYWIVKTDSLGNKQWDKDFGGTSDDYLFSIQQTADRGYIAGGSSKSMISGDKTQNSIGNDDYWIIKLDSSGNKQWDKDFGGTSNDELASLQKTTDEGYILAGFSASGTGGDKTQPTWGASDYWLVKIDSIGNKQWDKDFGGYLEEDDVGIVFQTKDDGYLIAGTSYSNLGGDKTENNLGVEQTWVVKTDSLGNKQWDKTLHTNSPIHDERGFSVQTNDGCYAMANCTMGGIAGDKTQPFWDLEDYWIIKFCDSTSTTSITQLPDYTNTFSIYPNPANEILVISDKALGKKEIEIYDLFGRRVLHSSFNIQHSSFTIDISKLSPGIYFLKAGNEVRKFVKE